MNKTKALRLGIVGCGHIARQQVAQWAKHGKVQVVAGVEPNATRFSNFAEAFEPTPHRTQSIEALLDTYGNQLDAVYIASPHVFHAKQTIRTLYHGVDVLLEKPMAFTITDAHAIEKAVNTTGRTLVVAFNGSLSPIIRATAEALQAGNFGKLHALSGTASENWAKEYKDHWKQNPDISGGGFLLDSGSHLINALLDITGSGFETVCACFKGEVEGIEYSASISGKLNNGALVALTVCGETIAPCHGELILYCERAVLRVDPWGTRPTMIRTDKGEHQLPFGEGKELIDIFQAVRAGKIRNPSPVDRNVELVCLWQAIDTSAKQHGIQIQLHEKEETYG